jgi:AraC family transcriptional regulator of adaptative response/methylated-DNA-[protein]-cysteine methyltransferase
MKIPFNKIKERLEDPFFERMSLGKDRIKQRTLPINKYAPADNNFQFVDWIEKDNKEVIQYAFSDTLIGRILLANTHKGICFLGFSSDDEIIQDMKTRFLQQQFEKQATGFQKIAIDYCNGNHNQVIPLHLKGTEFQVSIWKKLVCIPEGWLSTYGTLAPNAGGAQAIGSAVGANPVSYIIPCHRIVKRNGDFQGYHWGTEVKKMLLAYELQP